MTEHEEPMPYKGARLLLTEGVEAAKRDNLTPAAEQTEAMGMLVQAASNGADLLTVLLFGNDQQRGEVNRWMNRSSR